MGWTRRATEAGCMVGTLVLAFAGSCSTATGVKVTAPESLRRPGRQPGGTASKSSTTASRQVPRPAPAQKPLAPVVFDDVLAMVGTQVITSSATRDEFELQKASRLDALRRRDPAAKITPEIAAAIRRHILQGRINSHLLADHVNSLGHDRERIEQVVNNVLRERIEEQQHTAGSSVEFLASLKARGLTYEQFVADQRASIRQQIAISEEFRKAGASSPLLATPADLLVYYRKHPGKFRTKSTATVRVYTFEPTANGIAPKLRAAKARAARLAGTTPDVVAKEHGGAVRVIEGVTPSGGLAASLREFAFAPSSQAGAVSAPIPQASAAWLIELVSRTKGGVRPFVSREVQDEIRQALRTARQNQLLRKVEFQERRRVYIWPKTLDRS